MDSEINSSNIFYISKNTRVMFFFLSGDINCEIAHSTSSFFLIRFRNARKRNETNSQANDIDMYNSPNGKPGKNSFKWLVI